MHSDAKGGRIAAWPPLSWYVPVAARLDISQLPQAPTASPSLVQPMAMQFDKRIPFFHWLCAGFSMIWTLSMISFVQ